MASYTVHIFGRGGRDRMTATFEADDDDDARSLLVEAAIGGLVPIELWEGARLVRRFEPHELPAPPLWDDPA